MFLFCLSIASSLFFLFTSIFLLYFPYEMCVFHEFSSFFCMDASAPTVGVVRSVSMEYTSILNDLCLWNSEEGNGVKFVRILLFMQSLPCFIAGTPLCSINKNIRSSWLLFMLVEAARQTLGKLHGSASLYIYLSVF